MGLIYDNPDLAALTLTRLAAEEAEGPGALEGRMRRRRTRKQIPRPRNTTESREFS
jgi:hypothetical protein